MRYGIVGASAKRHRAIYITFIAIAFILGALLGALIVDEIKEMRYQDAWIKGYLSALKKEKPPHGSNPYLGIGDEGYRRTLGGK